MNKEEILNKYIDLIDKGYCSDCNELNCIDNFPHSKIARAIRELQQENEKLKAEYGTKAQVERDLLKEESRKYKEIINKATEYIKERFYFNEETGEYSLLHTIDKDNIKELLEILKGEQNER